MIVLVQGRSKSLKVDKNNISWVYGMMWFRLQMAGLNVVRSSDRTAEVGRFSLHYCWQERMNTCIVCCCLNLNKMVWMWFWSF